MKRDVFGGTLLIGGALAGMLIMALDPTAHQLMTGPGAARQVHLNALVHGVALAAVPVSAV